jgi:predicted phosphodiesterase
MATLFINPGYAGRPRFRLARSVAILRIEAAQLAVEFIDLP